MINYVKGDATQPIKRPALIIHICNDIGKWGSGFVLSLRKHWPIAEASYRDWFKFHADHLESATPFKLGEVQIVRVDTVGGDKTMWSDEAVYVANMIAQHNVKPYESIPLRLDALDKCLAEVARTVPVIHKDFSIHMPRIGTKRSGGRWVNIEPLIEKNLKDLEVYVYDFNE